MIRYKNEFLFLKLADTLTKNMHIKYTIRKIY